jgi:hypothetical protein
MVFIFMCKKVKPISKIHQSSVIFLFNTSAMLCVKQIKRRITRNVFHESILNYNHSTLAVSHITAQKR